MRGKMSFAAALLVAAGVGAQEVRNSFVTISCPVAVRTKGDGTFVLHEPPPGTVCRLIPRDGWRFANDEPKLEIASRPGARQQVFVYGRDGEEQGVVAIEDDWRHGQTETRREEHVRVPVLETDGQAHGLGLYDGETDGLRTLPVAASVVFASNGLHRITTTRSACRMPGCGDGETSRSEDREKTLQDGIWRSGTEIAPGTVNDRFAAGRYEWRCWGVWEDASCCDRACKVSAATNGVTDVHAAHVACPRLIGLDRTDEGRKKPLVVEANLTLEPGTGVEVMTEWMTGPLCEAGGESGTMAFRYGPKDRDRGSGAVEGEVLQCDVRIGDGDGCSASAVLERRYTVVKLDVDVGVEEKDEETNGCCVLYRPDEPGGTWTADAEDALLPVTIAWEPRDLPDDDKVTIAAPGGMLFERTGGTYRPAAESYTIADLRRASFFLHGTERSEEFRDREVRVVHEASGACDAARFTVLGEPKLVPDYDRDGRILEADRARSRDGKSVFRFWINDDDDDIGFFKRHNDECADGHLPGSGANYDDRKVNGRMDLEDFTPILLECTDVLPKKATAEDWERMSCLLESPCLNVVWTPMDENNVKRYLDPGEEMKSCGEKADVEVYQAPVESLAKEKPVPPVWLKPREDGRRYVVMLAEGRAKGRALTATVRIRGLKPLVGKLAIEIGNVEDMYRWLAYRVEGKGNVAAAMELGEPSHAPDSDCNGIDRENRHVIFVHGYNVNQNDAHAWGAEMFKRLWQAGMNAKFTVVDWLGSESRARWVNITPDYYVNVSNAFVTAAVMTDEFNNRSNFANDRMTYIGHSLGTLVVASAAKQCGLRYDRIVLMDGALPQEAFAPRDADAANPVMYPNAWHGVKPELFAANWYRLFPPEDLRSTLTWRGLFAGLGNVENWYADPEDVVSNPVKDEDGDCSGGGAWVMQEWMKGNFSWRILNGVTPNNVGVEAGWGLNKWYLTSKFHYVPFFGLLANVNEIDVGGVIENPVFARFEKMPEGCDLHDRKPIVLGEREAKAWQYYYLSCAIPAVSCAIGANATPGMARNYELKVKGWPAVKGPDDKCYHSDIKNKAYCYMRHIFEELVKGL